METKPSSEVLERLARRLTFALTTTIFGPRDIRRFEAVVHRLGALYGRADLGTPMLACLHELLVNGVKANMKRTFFQDRGLDIHCADQYGEGMRTFKDVLRPDQMLDYARKLKRAGLFVRLGIDHSKERIVFTVFNNVPLLPCEEQRIRQKFDLLMHTKKVAEFFMANVDATEGAGLGIALCIAMLRNLDNDPATLRMFSNEGGTTVRLVFPLMPTYVDQRSCPDVQAGPRSFVEVMIGNAAG